ncbi:cupin domain-containing protein [Acuticoccus sediminis]|uniref:cupin domain-containing protein n=1 Tax=Acuticoccus sediminis TaxID=2184697 RepID=UPI001B3B95FD|nr:cupin domain-containing protein [Acuticoccus sediminis]
MARNSEATPALSGSGTDPATVDEFGVPLVGSNIKRLRKERGLALTALSKLAQVSVGMLSQIERDAANPSLKVLTKIRFALDVPLAALFGEPTETTDTPTFVRRGDSRPFLDFGPDRMVKELLSPGVARNLEMMILHIPPGGNSGDQPLKFVAEKGGVVLDGTLWLTVDGRTVRCNAGDSFQFDSDLEHSFGNDTESPCRVLWIIAQPVTERHL